VIRQLTDKRFNCISFLGVFFLFTWRLKFVFLF